MIRDLLVFWLFFFAELNSIVNLTRLFHTKVQEMNSFFNSAPFSTLPQLAQPSSTTHTCSASAVPPLGPHRLVTTVHQVLEAPLQSSLCVCFTRPLSFVHFQLLEPPPALPAAAFIANPRQCPPSLHSAQAAPSPSVLTLCN